MWSKYKLFVQTDENKIIEIKDESLKKQLTELQNSGNAKTIFQGADNGIVGCIFERNLYTEPIATKQWEINIRAKFNIHPNVPLTINTDVISVTIPIDTPYGETFVTVPVCDRFLQPIEYDAESLIQEAINEILIQRQQLQMVQDVTQEVQIRHIMEHPPMLGEKQEDVPDANDMNPDFEDIEYDNWIDNWH